MREELTEPKHWRTRSERAPLRNQSWSARRRSQEQAQLEAHVVDAALEQQVVDEPPATTEQPNANDIISSLSQHLEQLEEQRAQIQRLLDQAQGL